MEKMCKNKENIVLYDECHLCPRNCMVDRNAGQKGVCGMTGKLRLARAALHFWEEPCISGERGSGAIFFSGCSLHCVFCQNEDISRGLAGKEIDDKRLVEIMHELKAKGANNLNLVTPGHYVPTVIKAVEQAKNEGMDIPVIYNTSGYETVDTIKALEGVVDVYLPDFKYMNPQIAEKYSHAGDYPPVAKLAIEEMVRQKSRCLFYPERSTLKDSMKNGTVTSEAEEGYLIGQGIIVRQLLLPGLLSDAKEIVRYLHERYGDSIYLSLMSQYTPLKHVEKYPELNRKVTDEEYEAYIDYAIEIGVEKGFIQEGDVAEESFIPHFDCEGV